MPHGSLLTRATSLRLPVCRLPAPLTLTSLHVLSYTTEEERQGLVGKLRVVARQEYLKKREDAQLQALEEELADEDLLFPDKSKLTAKERADYEYKKQVLALAKERLALEQSLVQDEYALPEWYDEPGKERLDRREQALF